MNPIGLERQIRFIRVAACGFATAATLFTLAFVLLASSASQRTFVVFDDAYMFLRYADNFISSGEFSWNQSDGPAYGCTSAMQLFWATGLRYISPDLDGRDLLMGSSLFMGVAAT